MPRARGAPSKAARQLLAQSKKLNKISQSIKAKKIKTLVYRVKSGSRLTFNLSKKACQPFGFYPGQIVMTTNNIGVVIGVSEEFANKKVLWFHLNGERGASYYDIYKKDDFKESGFKLLVA